MIFRLCFLACVATFSHCSETLKSRQVEARAYAPFRALSVMVEAVWKTCCTVFIEQAFYRALDSRSFRRFMTHPDLSREFCLP
jgi:hypothetical protein